MNYPAKGAYSVFYRTERDNADDRCEFKTNTKTWDCDDWEMEMLAQEVADQEFHNCDGWEWWRPGEAISIWLYAPEVEGGEPGGALLGEFIASYDVRPDFTARKKK